MSKFTDAQVEQKIAGLSGWSYADGEIVKQFQFPKFADGIEFVNAVAKSADAMDHHPDIDIRYTSIRIGLSSHDVGGITDRDFNLAAEIEALH